jgi:hypothetical protein
MWDNITEALVIVWLISILVSLLVNIIFNVIALVPAKVDVRMPSDSLPESGGAARFAKLVTTMLYAIPVISSGLSLGMAIGIAFAGQDNVLFVWNGVPVGVTWYSILMGLFFGAGAAAATFYGGSFYVDSIFHVLQWIISKTYRKENKILAIQWAVFIGTAIGVVVILLLLIFGAFEFTLAGVLLCAYTPVIGALLAAGFTGPWIFIASQWAKK